MFTELSLGCWSSGHRNLSMYQVSSSTVLVFFFVSYMHIHAPFIMYCSRLFVVVNNILLNMPMFVGSQSFISLLSFIFVSAVVSEIHESNRKKKEKKNSEIDYFHLSWAYITHILTRGTFRAHVQIQLVRSPLHHKLKVIILKYTIMLAKPGPSLYTQYYRTV